ncbi:MAG: PQQ-binding-like beta-propeller repeat protein [Proteobacteria bacterium]|nr:PQQ-binding-like beta-propeller repeat protein [Pseudomonadota bacterium]
MNHLRSFRKYICIIIFILSVSFTAYAADGDLKWAFETKSWVRSSPAIGEDGTIYVGSMGKDMHLYAIHSDGSLKWSYNMDNTAVERSPAIADDGTIYIPGTSGMYLFAIKPDGTSYKWKTMVFPGNSPGIGADGTIYVSNNVGDLYWLSPDTASKTCVHNAEGDVGSSPAIGADGRVYFGDDAGYLHAVGPGCDFHWRTITGGAIQSSPAIAADGTIYVGSGDGKLYAFNSDGTPKWNFATGARINSSPAIGPDGTIYAGSDDMNLYAIHPDGTLKWTYATSGSLRASPAIGADGTIYIGSNDFSIYAINSDGTLKWRYQTGGYVFSSPAIGSDGTIYIGSDDNKLYAIEGSSGGLAGTSWPMYRQNPRHTGRVPEETPAPNPDPVIDPLSVEGDWTYTESNKTDSCSTPSSAETGGIYLEKTETGYQTTVDNDHVYDCTLDEDTVTCSGTYTHNNGTVSDIINLIFSDDRTTAQGTVSWTWVSGAMTCTGGHDLTLSHKAAEDNSGGGGGGCFIISCTHP